MMYYVASNGMAAWTNKVKEYFSKRIPTKNHVPWATYLTGALTYHTNTLFFNVM